MRQGSPVFVREPLSRLPCGAHRAQPPPPPSAGCRAVGPRSQALQVELGVSSPQCHSTVLEMGKGGSRHDPRHYPAAPSCWDVLVPLPGVYSASI